MKIKILTAFVLLLWACNKDPEFTTVENGGLAFYNASQLLRVELEQKNPLNVQQPALILLNTTDKNHKPDSAAGADGKTLPFFAMSTGGQQMFPMYGFSQVTPPWLTYMRVRSGIQQISFLKTDSTLAVKTDVVLDAGENTTVFLMDSLGEYATMVLHDDSKPAANQVQLRMVHTSPDAGELMVKVNGQWLGKDTLGFRDATGFLSFTMPDSVTSTIYRVQVSSKSDTSGFIAKGALIGAKGHSYTMVMNGYVESHFDPIYVEADFRLSFLRNK
ncbi:DUF4397 domain-containing protein [Chitinophaga sp. SYP-B3965]|uniref:DUF4397 domain-containing protein n=1 Tax=Chitinophaga sp. SYP-B3965 TaxID=2663120 RepID=UPI00156736D9|nr:DUF4397 domain-containing protein [Chitinophaga sp. SYP-B3965]